MTQEIGRRLVNGSWVTNVADESGGGGSQPGSVRLLDLGVVSVNDVAEGPETLYTPDADEFVTEIRLLDFTYMGDGNGFILGVFSGERYGPVACLGNDGGSTQDSASVGLLGIGQIAAGADIDAEGAQIALTLPDDPLILSLSTHDSAAAAAAPWTALTAKVAQPVADVLIAAGHLWNPDTDGDTGASEPDWEQALIDGFVLDGDITWTDAGAIGGAKPWQPNTTYSNADGIRISAAGHIWRGDVGPGTTGAVEPDFAGNIGGSVVDNTVTWTDEGALPPPGQARVLICVVTPVEP